MQVNHFTLLTALLLSPTLAQTENATIDQFGFSLQPQLLQAPMIGGQFTLQFIANGLINPIISTGFQINYDPQALSFVENSFKYVLLDIAGLPCDNPQAQCITLDPPNIDNLNGVIEGGAGCLAGSFGLNGQLRPIAEVSFEVLVDFEETSVTTNAGGPVGLPSCLFHSSCAGLTFFGTTVIGPSVDLDSDGVVDSLDNCTELENPNQRDTDNDGYGNRCDPDLDNNGVVDFDDLPLLRVEFFMEGDLDSDFDGDMVVNFNDFSIMKTFMFSTPGPRGLITH